MGNKATATQESEDTSISYKINGTIHSFKSKEQLAELVKNAAIAFDGLEVEPVSKQGEGYDHMQEILDLSYEAIPCIKGMQAMAMGIQQEGSFRQYSPTDIIELGIRCNKRLDEMMDIAEAAIDVYESDHKAQKAKLKRLGLKD